MGNRRIKTAAQWLAEVAAREAIRAAMRWIWNLVASGGAQCVMP